MDMIYNYIFLAVEFDLKSAAYRKNLLIGNLGPLHKFTAKKIQGILHNTISLRIIDCQTGRAIRMMIR